MKDSVFVGGLSTYSINPENFTVEIYFTGCNHKCKDCHNKELQQYFVCYEKTPDELFKEVKGYLRFAKELHILGGEPLLDDYRCKFLCGFLDLVKKNFPNVVILLYTGWNFEDVYKKYPEVLSRVDFLKTGAYISFLKKEKKLNENFKLATENQHIYKITEGGKSHVLLI